MKTIINEAINNEWAYCRSQIGRNSILQVWQNEHTMVEYTFGVKGKLIKTKTFWG